MGLLHTVCDCAAAQGKGSSTDPPVPTKDLAVASARTVAHSGTSLQTAALVAPGGAWLAGETGGEREEVGDVSVRV